MKDHDHERNHAMKELLLTLAALAAATVVGGAAADGSASAAACKPGNTTHQGVRARIYCGPASAVVKVGNRTLEYRGGRCIRNRVAVELGIGTLILDAKDPKVLPRSFGISVGRIFGIGKAAPKDGTYTSVMIAYVDNGKRYAAGQAKATLTGNRSRGSFTGKLLTGEPISGTFRCS
jgi:hypothetical protein